jgi:ABC-type branched-subunit amino acid transport system substrate-binding protein
MGEPFAAEPVKAGIVCEMTGPSAASGTKKWERAVQMVAEEINKAVDCIFPRRCPSVLIRSSLEKVV